MIHKSEISSTLDGPLLTPILAKMISFLFKIIFIAFICGISIPSLEAPGNLIGFDLPFSTLSSHYQNMFRTTSEIYITFPLDWNEKTAITKTSDTDFCRTFFFGIYLLMGSPSASPVTKTVSIVNGLNKITEDQNKLLLRAFVNPSSISATALVPKLVTFYYELGSAINYIEFGIGVSLSNSASPFSLKFTAFVDFLVLGIHVTLVYFSVDGLNPSINAPSWVDIAVTYNFASGVAGTVSLSEHIYTTSANYEPAGQSTVVLNPSATMSQISKGEIRLVNTKKYQSTYQYIGIIIKVLLEEELLHILTLHLLIILIQHLLQINMYLLNTA